MVVVNKASGIQRAVFLIRRKTAQAVDKHILSAAFLIFSPIGLFFEFKKDFEILCRINIVLDFLRS